MKTSRMRLLAISGATLALVVAGTSVVTANHRDDDQRGPDKGRAGASFQRGGDFRNDMREHFGGGQRGDREHFGGGQRGDRGSLRGEVRQRIGGQIDSFVRRETTVDLGEEGIVTRLVDNGSVTSASDAGLDYTLATGESVSVVIDENTEAIAFSEPDESTLNQGRRHFRGPRLLPTEIAVADIEAGSEVVVWAQSQDDGSFLAQRIVVQPVIEDSSADVDADADEASDADAAAVGTDA